MSETLHKGEDYLLSNADSPEGLELPDEVTGHLIFNSLQTAEGLTLPEYVSGDLHLQELTSGKGLKLPKRIGGDLWMNDLQDLDGLKLPEYVGGDIHLYELKEYDLTIHGPDELGGRVVTQSGGFYDLEYMNLMIVDISSGTDMAPPRNIYEIQLKADLEKEIAEIGDKGGTVWFPID